MLFMKQVGVQNAVLTPFVPEVQETRCLPPFTIWDLSIHMPAVTQLLAVWSASIVRCAGTATMRRL